MVSLWAVVLLYMDMEGVRGGMMVSLGTFTIHFHNKTKCLLMQVIKNPADHLPTGHGCLKIGTSDLTCEGGACGSNGTWKGSVVSAAVFYRLKWTIYSTLRGKY